MNKKFTYQTVLMNGPFKGVYAEFPFDSVTEFGTKRHVWCKVLVEDKSYSMNLLPNGNGGHWLHLKKEIRLAIGKEEGDTISVVVEKDDSPRKIEIPDYLEWLLEEEPLMMKYYNKLPISARKFWIEFIEEPKNEDTKVERINRFFKFIKERYSK